MPETNGPAPAPLRVLLVDDHPAVRMGVRAILESADADEPLDVVAEAASAGAAVVELRTHRPDVVLLDLGLPDVRGPAAVALMCDADPTVRVLVLSSDDSPLSLRECLDRGAGGYVLKTSSPALIRQGIRAVAERRQFVDPVMMRNFLEGVDDRLSPREMEVLQAISHGLTNRQVAARLNLTEHTVKTHLASAMNKLQAHDRTHAVATLLRRGWLS